MLLNINKEKQYNLNILESKKSKKVQSLPTYIVLDTEEYIKKYLSNPKIKIDRKIKKIIINKYKKTDKNWYLTTFLITILKNTKSKLDNKKLSYLLISSKFANLLVSDSYKFNKIYENKNIFDAFKNMALDNAKLYDEQFYIELKIIFKNLEIKNNKTNITSVHLNEKYLNNIWSITQPIFNIYLKEIFNVLNLELNHTNISTILSDYYSLKKEIINYFKFNKKKNNDLLINDQNYEKASSEMMIFMDNMKKEMYFIHEEIIEEIIFNLSDLEIKINLSDSPPLTISQWIGLFIRYAILIGWAIVILFPVVILIRQTFNYYVTSNTNEMVKWMFSIENFRRLFLKTQYLRWLGNSILIAIGSMIIQVFCVSLTAYAFSRFKFRGKRSFTIALLVTQMIPAFTSLLVYYILTSILNNAFKIPPIVTLLLIYTGGGIASNTIILKGYMDSISTDIDDAAKIDGCSNFWIFANIIFPLCKPVLVLIALMSFIGPFGDVILPKLILKNPSQFTVAIGLKFLLDNDGLRDFGAWFAGSLFIAVPIVILFLSLQKYVVSGLTSGGVKG